MKYFENLTSYADYLKDNPFHKKLSINLESYGAIEKKTPKKSNNLSPEDQAYAASLDDLVRLHYLATSRKVMTILEFGVGKSSIVFDDALEKNKKIYADFVSKNLRRKDPFLCYSVDDNEHWIKVCKTSAETKNVIFHHSASITSDFNGKVCTFYENLPNICPDLIYLDAPCYYTPIGDVRGISTNHPDRMPMAGDILSFEHFLLPGTLIVVDGRGANARFLKANLQRNWSYSYSEEFDQHFFELTETPLGIYNRKQIDFCLGDQFYNRIT